MEIAVTAQPEDTSSNQAKDEAGTTASQPISGDGMEGNRFQKAVTAWRS